MNTLLTPRRILPVLLCLGLFPAGTGPIDFFTLSAEAASKDRRKLNTCNRKLRKQRALVRGLRNQLVAALLSVPTPAGMVLIPAGAFKMGDETEGDGSGQADELPTHTVTVSAFYIDEFEVTKALWDDVVAWGAANGYNDLPAGGGQGNFHPVQDINWYAVVKWCNARSEMEGLTPVYYTDEAQTTVYKSGTNDLAGTRVDWEADGFRLPTEAEWEKAARGGAAGNTYPWGDTIVMSDANYNGSGDPFDIGGTETTPVGFYDGDQMPVGPNRANGFGLYDVSGNVWEWCWDWYDEDYYGPPDTDPLGPASSPSDDRVLRGGSWIAFTGSLRCANRFDFNPVSGLGNIGFRSARGL